MDSNIVRLRSGSLMEPFLSSPEQKSDRTVHRAFFRLLACVLITLLWAGSPAVVNAQSANSTRADSSFERQLQADPGQSRSESRSVKSIPNQPPNSFIQYGDVWGCNDGFDKSGNKCVSIFSKIGGQPDNSYVQYGTIWGCRKGFRREGNKCVSIFTKRKVISKKEEGISKFFSSQ